MTQRVAWVQLAGSEPLFWRWFLVRVIVTTVPTLLCFHGGAGLLGCVTFALGAYPWPVRLTLDARGITLSSLLMRATWEAETLERVTVEMDSRRCAWPRRRLLVIERRGYPAVRVFGEVARLTELARAACELQNVTST